MKAPELKTAHINLRLTKTQKENFKRMAKADNRGTSEYAIHHLNLNGLKGGRPKIEKGTK